MAAKQREVVAGGVSVGGVVIQTLGVKAGAPHLQDGKVRRSGNTETVPWFPGSQVADAHRSVPVVPVLGNVQVGVNVLQVPVEAHALEPLPQQEALCDVTVILLQEENEG